jgi:hypothetical protein
VGAARRAPTLLASHPPAGEGRGRQASRAGAVLDKGAFCLSPQAFHVVFMSRACRVEPMSVLVTYCNCWDRLRVFAT